LRRRLKKIGGLRFANPSYALNWKSLKDVSTAMTLAPQYTKSGVLTAAIAAAIVGVCVGLVIGSGSFKAAQDWQTLIAALIALLAASMAYRSAMAKVDFDRNESHEI
jgi:high-affinity Fe2+/Pb2+ permease